VPKVLTLGYRVQLLGTTAKYSVLKALILYHIATKFSTEQSKILLVITFYTLCAFNGIR